MKIHCIRHEPFEGLACIESWITANKYNVNFTYSYLSQTLPVEDDFDMLIIMGGSASVYDSLKESWLLNEMRIIEQCIKNNKLVLGICLGSQIIAQVLGSRVYKGEEPEIGWFPVNFCKTEHPSMHFLPESMTTFHWHGDTYDLPAGSVRLASSELTLNQGFIYEENVIGLQFHPETTPESLKKIIKGTGWKLSEDSKYMQTAQNMRNQLHHIDQNIRFTYQLLDFFTRSRLLASKKKRA